MSTGTALDAVGSRSDTADDAPAPIDHDAVGDRLDRAERHLTFRSAALQSLLLGVVDRRITREVPALGVRLRGDGLPTLLVNPDFALDLTAEDLAFVLAHEATHLLLNHLRVEQSQQDAAFRLAAEAVVNRLVMQAMHAGLPVSQASGEPVGVDPDELHAEYRRRADTPLSARSLFATDVDCAAELRRVGLPDELPDESTHASGPSEGCGSTLDTVEGGDALVDRTLDVAVDRAMGGDDVIRKQLIGLEDQFPDSPALARAGITGLRTDRTPLTGRTSFWQVHVAAIVGTALEPGTAIAYDRKTGWWDQRVLAAAGLDLPPGTAMPLLPAATRVPSRRLAVYLDTSGSVGQDVVDAVATTVGSFPGATISWHAFDHAVHPFAPGDPLPGGGGTSFDVIVDHVEALDDRPDAVLVLTDGYADPVDPPGRADWIWLITPGGDPWPAAAGMACVRVDPRPHTRTG